MNAEIAEAIFDHYEQLGVDSDADEPTIRRAYRRLALRYHPDKNKASDAPEKFRLVTVALETLVSQERRSKFDEERRARHAQGSKSRATEESRAKQRAEMFERESRARSSQQTPGELRNIEALKMEGFRLRRELDARLRTWDSYPHLRGGYGTEVPENPRTLVIELPPVLREAVHVAPPEPKAVWESRIADWVAGDSSLHGVFYSTDVERYFVDSAIHVVYKTLEAARASLLVALSSPVQFRSVGLLEPGWKQAVSAEAELRAVKDRLREVLSALAHSQNPSL